jgi:hypothetical protein
MRKSAWSSSQDPEEMLNFLRVTGKLSVRKRRLFAVACCRRVWQLLSDPRSRQAVEVAEQFADDGVENTVLTAASEEAAEAWQSCMAREESCAWEGAAAMAAYTASSPEVREVVTRTPEYATDAVEARYGGHEDESRERLRRQESGAQADLLRDIIGPLPFRPVTIDPSLLRWNDGTVFRLAQAAHETRRLPAGTLEPERLAVLADALEDAGCNDLDILGHLREPGAWHVRGCWAVDCLAGGE